MEDEKDIQSIARIALENAGGFTLKVCSSVQKAIESAAAFEPSLILLDVMMPGMDGFITYGELRKIPL
jgi:DNA-binding response OmpR family regulator